MRVLRAILIKTKDRKKKYLLKVGSRGEGSEIDIQKAD